MSDQTTQTPPADDQQGGELTPKQNEDRTWPDPDAPEQAPRRSEQQDRGGAPEQGGASDEESSVKARAREAYLKRVAASRARDRGEEVAEEGAEAEGQAGDEDAGTADAGEAAESAEDGTEPHPSREQPRDPETGRFVSREAVQQAQRQAAQARRENERMREENIRLRAQLEVSNSLRQKLLSDPEIRHEYEDVRAINPKAAEKYLRGLEQEHAAEIENEVRRRTQADRVRREADSFRREMVDHATSGFPALRGLPHLGQIAEAALRSYGAELDMLERKGHQVSIDRGTFIEEHLKPRLFADPQVRDRLRRVKEARDRHKAEEHRKKLEAESEKKRQARQTQAEEQVREPAGSAAAAPGRGAGADEEPDFGGMTAGEIKRYQREKYIYGRGR